MTQRDLDVIQEKIGYDFNEPELLMQAFTRKSFTSENIDWEHNEKLEFIGDRALDFIVVKKLTALFGFFEKRYVLSPEFKGSGRELTVEDFISKNNFRFAYSEGEMTDIKKQVVQTRFLAEAVERLNLEEYLIMGKGDVKNNVQNEPHVKEDLLEAIIGAVAIDSHWNTEAIETVVDRVLNLDYYLKNGVAEDIDYISYINNWHRKEYGKDPEYDFSSTGRDAFFECSLDLKGYGDGFFDGFGYSKKEAIRMAAKRAYLYLKEKNKLSKAVFDIIGIIDFDNSVSKLQMLKDKKIIGDVVYTFTELPPDESSNGNPVWGCRCDVEGFRSVEYFKDTKMSAKKAASYEMLQTITGRNRIAETFITHGEEVIPATNDEN